VFCRVWSIGGIGVMALRPGGAYDEEVVVGTRIGDASAGGTLKDNEAGAVPEVFYGCF